MKKTFFFLVICIVVSSCASYNFAKKYYAPSTLFHENKFSSEFDVLEVLIHDKDGKTFKATDPKIDNNEFVSTIHPIKNYIILENLKSSLNAEKIRENKKRYKEIHVFLKDTLNKRGSIKIKSENVEEIVSYIQNPQNIKKEIKKVENRELNGFLKFFSGALGVFILTAVIIALIIIAILNAIFNAIEDAISGLCYIATMVYGSSDSDEVLILRRFRDEKLKKTFIGRLFILVYYGFSPLFVKIFKNSRIVNQIIKRQLDKFVDKLKYQNNWQQY